MERFVLVPEEEYKKLRLSDIYARAVDDVLESLPIETSELLYGSEAWDEYIYYTENQHLLLPENMVEFEHE